MLYKNYWLCYNHAASKSVIAILNEGFDPTIKRGDKDGSILMSNTKKLISIENEKINNCREYLDENGLFMGMFPPEFLEEQIANYKKKEEKLKKERFLIARKNYLESLKRPLDNEIIYNAYLEGKISKEELVKTINEFNKEAYEIYGINHSLQEYELIFKKYNII